MTSQGPARATFISAECNYSSVSLIDDNRLLFLFAAVVLTTFGAVGLGVFGALATLTTLLTGGPILGAVALTVFGPLALLGLDVVLTVALLRELRRRARLPNHQGVADWLARLERVLPPLATLGLADRFEPSLDDQQGAITQRYVAGDLSEAELEAALEALLDEEIPDADGDQRVAGTVAQADPSREQPAEHSAERLPERSRG